MKYRRTKPYSSIGIRRVPCTRCGNPSEFQWRACAMGGWMGVCKKCDILLNRMVLRFFKVDSAKEIMADYERKVRL